MGLLALTKYFLDCPYIDEVDGICESTRSSPLFVAFWIAILPVISGLILRDSINWLKESPAPSPTNNRIHFDRVIAMVIFISLAIAVLTCILVDPDELC